MRSTISGVSIPVWVAIWLVVGSVHAHAAAPPIGPWSIVRAAVAAVGGKDALARTGAKYAKYRGTTLEGSMRESFQGEKWQNGALKSRTVELTSEIIVKPGQAKWRSRTTETVRNGDRIWVASSGERTREAGNAATVSADLAYYFGEVENLTLLCRSPALFKVEIAQNARSKDDMVELRISSPGKPVVSLSLDRRSWLVVKSEYALPLGRGQSIAATLFFSNFKMIGGRKVPMRRVVIIGGARTETDIVEFRDLSQDQLDDSLFLKP